MTRSAVAFIVISTLLAQCLGAQQPPANPAIQQSIAALPANAHVALHLSNGNTIRGRVASTGDNDFVLKPDHGSAPQTIAYTQVSSVEEIKGHSTKKWVIVGVVAAVVTVGVIVLVVVAEHGKGF